MLTGATTSHNCNHALDIEEVCRIEGIVIRVRGIAIRQTASRSEGRRRQRDTRIHGKPSRDISTKAESGWETRIKLLRDEAAGDGDWLNLVWQAGVIYVAGEGTLPGDS